ncbi:multidrug resistance-associated protein 1-like protein [Lates japonicus]|uniref:Multidrug resistance-associated protein 1-like protein n=1 Tax=Lates japonicus TaxID=270547 RepID=A0AAD3RIL5_LATJO|nr:multidrug resistance-associated protein 1-like protein [Lates japonicus]
MSSSARRHFTLGEIVNLVSADTQKLMDFVVYFNSVWIAPIEIALCFYFLWQLLGPPALAGITAVVFIFPLNGLIAKMRSKLQEVQMKFMDGRIKLMNEILSGVKILKFYACEEAFLRRVCGYAPSRPGSRTPEGQHDGGREGELASQCWRPSAPDLTSIARQYATVSGRRH